MFSSFMLDQIHGWIAVHRLSLDSAIHYAKECRVQYNCSVAVVPDCEDPAPYLQVALGLPPYGAANPEGYTPTTFA